MQNRHAPSAAVRYAIVASIVLIVGGIFVYRDVLPGAEGEQFGILDTAVRPEVGGAAPDFVLEEAGTGKPIKLSDYRGKRVILNFWATWCTPCRAEMPIFEQTYVEDGGKDVVVLAVDYRETDELVAIFQKDVKVSFPLVMDRNGSVRAQYGAQGLPATYFIDREGIVRAQNLGPVVGNLLPEGLKAADRGSR